MLARFKTLAAAIVTLLIGPSFAASAEILPVSGEDRTEAAAPAGDAGEPPNVMGDIV